MPTPKMWSQERMPVDVVPLPKKQGYDSFAEIFDDPKCPIDKKLNILVIVYQLFTLNGLTKRDLHAMIKWLIDQNYDFTRG